MIYGSLIRDKLHYKRWIALKALSDKRLKLIQQIQDEQKSEVIVASTTNDAWCTFLSIVNDLAQIESNTVDAIIADISAKKKTGQIDYYHRVLQSIEHGYYKKKSMAAAVRGHALSCDIPALQFCAVCPAILFLCSMSPRISSQIYFAAKSDPAGEACAPSSA